MRHSAAAALSLALFALPRPARSADAPGEKPFDAAAVADELWKERLDFKGDQARRFAAARQAKEEASASLRAQLRAGFRKVRSQIAARSPDKEVLETLQQLVRLRKSLRDEDEKFEAAIAAFLNPTQRAKVMVGDPMDAGTKGEAAAAQGTGDMRDVLTEGDGEPE